MDKIAEVSDVLAKWINGVFGMYEWEDNENKKNDVLRIFSEMDFLSLYASFLVALGFMAIRHDSKLFADTMHSVELFFQQYSKVQSKKIEILSLPNFDNVMKCLFSEAKMFEMIKHHLSSIFDGLTAEKARAVLFLVAYSTDAPEEYEVQEYGLVLGGKEIVDRWGAQFITMASEKQLYLDKKKSSE